MPYPTFAVESFTEQSHGDRLLFWARSPNSKRSALACVPIFHSYHTPMPHHRWTDTDDRRLLEYAAANGNDRVGLSHHLGLPYQTVDNHIARKLRDRYREAVDSYSARMRAQRSVTPQMEPNVPEYKDGTGRLYQVRVGRNGLRVDLAQLRDNLLADLAALPKSKFPDNKPPKGGLLHLVSPADLHIGKLAWEPETGESFDSKVAEDRLHTVIGRLLSHAEKYPIAEHLFVVGNDLLQVDNLLSTTTAGTFQDTDSRYRKMFRLAVKLMRETVERLAQTARVRVIVVPGNHDQLASFHVGEVLGAIYSGSERVSVSDNLMPRLYHRHGTTLLGFCHGNEEKHVDLPLIMAQENPADWGKTVYREFLVGHLHKKRERAYNAGDSHNGVRVIVLPSLTGTDSWHARRGYIGEPKASESRLYDQQEGLVATFTGRAE